MHEIYDREILQTPFARQPLTIGHRLGIIGGGQLAKMTAMAGLQLGCDVVILERNNYSPAANLASHSIVGDWNNLEALAKLASQVDVITLENEFIDATSLTSLEQLGVPLLPRAATLRLIQDKFDQKQALVSAGLPVPQFRAVACLDDVHHAAKDFGWPLVLKARRNAYDGKGNATVRHPDELSAAWSRLRGDQQALFVEEFCAFERELAIIITRGRDGASVAYPLVESLQKDHICHVVQAPAVVPAAVAETATTVAQRAVELIGGIGSMGVEMFLLPDGRILVNELAPRVHNTGHYTIEACVCSQFENHVRAVLGWPLGSTTMRAPAAAMVNLLGHSKGPAFPHGLEQALAVPGAHVHLYGKVMSGPGRKMGHVTALGETVAAASQTAQRAADCIRFGAAT